MKKLFGRFFRLFLYITYPVIVVGLIVAVVFAVVQTRELDSLNATFREATADINEENENKGVTIENLRQQFNDLNSEVTKLKAENTQLKASLDRMQLEGNGTITGKLVPVITGSTTGISQYQRICAESTTNSNIQVCRTVATIQQGYSLSLPVGTYKVYAEVYPATEETAKLKAYYTEFANCLQGSDTSKCSAAEQNKPVNIEVKAGNTLGNVDPIDWRI